MKQMSVTTNDAYFTKDTTTSEMLYGEMDIWILLGSR